MQVISHNQLFSANEKRYRRADRKNPKYTFWFERFEYLDPKCAAHYIGETHDQLLDWYSQSLNELEYVGPRFCFVGDALSDEFVYQISDLDDWLVQTGKTSQRGMYWPPHIKRF